MPKPVYRGFQLMRRLHDTALAVYTDIDVSTDAIATTDGDTVEVLVSHHPNSTTTGDVNGLAVNVTLRFSGASWRDGNSVALRRVDDSHANALLTYEDLGSPVYPTATQLDQLQDASIVQVESLDVSVVDEDHFEVTIEVPAYGLASISF